MPWRREGPAWGGNGSRLASLAEGDPLLTTQALLCGSRRASSLGVRGMEGAWPGLPPALLCSLSLSSVVMLEIDNRLCLQSPENDHCFPDAQSAADYLGALSAVERLDFPYPLRDVRGASLRGGWGR